MPKAKVASKSKVSPKLLPNKSISGLKVIALTVLGAFLLVGGYLYSTMQKSGINEIREVGGGISRPMPKPEPRDCETVSSFSLSGSCGVGSYQMVSYTCGKSGNQRKLGATNTNPDKAWMESDQGRKSCKSYTTLYNEAQEACATACPKATPIAKPTQSAKPSPVTCAQMTGFCVTKMNGTTKVCSSYKDSCQKASICLPQYAKVSCE